MLFLRLVQCLDSTAAGAKAAAKGEGESDNVVEVETAATAAPTTTAWVLSQVQKHKVHIINH